MSEEMRGKTCLVTGATLGIGKETALGLARMGARVVIVGRDEQRGRETAAWIAQQSGNPQVDHLVADLALQAEVRRLAAAVSLAATPAGSPRRCAAVPSPRLRAARRRGRRRGAPA